MPPLRNCKQQASASNKLQAQTALLLDALKGGIAELATKADAEAIKATAKADLDNAVTRLEGKLAVIEERTAGRFRLLYWMIGFNLAISVAVLWKLMH